MKNKISILLMETGEGYKRQRLHKTGYFRELLGTHPDIDEGLCALLRVCRVTVVCLGRTKSPLVKSMDRNLRLRDHVKRLMTAHAVGPITVLTLPLEIGEMQRLSSLKNAICYCGLCGTEMSLANPVQRTPLSKQRNKHLQMTLIKPAKMAPRYSPDLALLYDREKRKGIANRATLVVARKLVAYRMAI